MYRRRTRTPAWIIGVGLLTLALVVVGRVITNEPDPAAQVFMGIGAVGVPVDVMTPLADGGVVVTVTSTTREVVGVKVHGTVENDTAAAVMVPLSAFSFTDSLGVLYTSSDASATELAPGQRTTWDMGLPVPEDRTLTLHFTLQGAAPQTLPVPAVEEKGRTP